MALDLLTKEENLLKNLAVVKSKVTDGKLCVALNANAYGHGIVRVARLIENAVDCFLVGEDGDTALLKRHGIKKPIFIEKFAADTMRVPFCISGNRECTDKSAKSELSCDCLSVYGYPRGELLPVMEVYSQVLGVLNVPPYASLGSCHVGRLGATVAIIQGGFSDGFGGDFIGSHMLINGKRYPVVAVFTNNTLLRVDDRVNTGDRVCVCGSSDRKIRYFDELSREVGTDIRELMIRFGQGNDEKD